LKLFQSFENMALRKTMRDTLSSLSVSRSVMFFFFNPSCMGEQAITSWWDDLHCVTSLQHETMDESRFHTKKDERGREIPAGPTSLASASACKGYSTSSSYRGVRME
jgi:hypothetical protein